MPSDFKRNDRTISSFVFDTVGDLNVMEFLAMAQTFHRRCNGDDRVIITPIIREDGLNTGNFRIECTTEVEERECLGTLTSNETSGS